MTVAFQGWPGAYSEAAVRLHFSGDVEALGRPTFEAAVRAAASGRARAAVIPVENTTTGPVAGGAEAVALGQRLGLVQDGWVLLPVRHALIGLDGAALADVRTVRSHPQALAQCAGWLASALPEAQIEAGEDTAGSARDLAADPDTTVAAIAHASAAERYGLAVLMDGIEDRPDNATRFAVLVAR